MGIDGHCPFNGAGCRIVTGVFLDQRGRAGLSAAVPAADGGLNLGSCIGIATEVKCKVRNITAQACAAVVHIFRDMGLIGNRDGIRPIGYNWRDREAVVISNGDARLRSIHVQGTRYRLTSLGKLVVERQIVLRRKDKAIWLECNRPIGIGTVGVIAGRISRFGQPCWLGNRYRAFAADVQAVEHAIFTGKQLRRVAYLLTACATRQKKIIVDSSLICNFQRRRRISFYSLTCVEFCTAKSQGGLAAVRQRFYNHIGFCVCWNIITGSIGRNRLTAYRYAAIDIAVQRGINGVPQLKGGVQRYGITGRGILPGSIVDCPGDCFVRQTAALVDLRLCRYRLVFRIAEVELCVVFKLHRVEVAVSIYGCFICRYIACSIAV